MIIMLSDLYILALLSSILEEFFSPIICSMYFFVLLTFFNKYGTDNADEKEGRKFAHTESRY